MTHDNKGYSEEKCVRCGWVMGHPPLNCNNDDTPHIFPSQTEQSFEKIHEYDADNGVTSFFGRMRTMP